MVSALVAAAVAILAGHGFDAPVWKTSVPIAESETADGIVTRNCVGFGDFVVVEVNDPGNKGAVSIGVLKRGEKNAASPCAEEAAEKGLSPVDGYFWGAVGKFGFVRSADSFGNMEEFHVFDLETGSVVFAGSGELDPLKVVKKGKVLSLEYRHQLEVECALALEGEACWKSVLEKNAVPAAVKIAMPDCAKAFRKGESPLDNTALVTVPARIADLAKPAVEFVKGGRAECHPAP